MKVCNKVVNLMFLIVLFGITSQQSVNGQEKNKCDSFCNMKEISLKVDSDFSADFLQITPLVPHDSKEGKNFSKVRNEIIDKMSLIKDSVLLVLENELEYEGVRVPKDKYDRNFLYSEGGRIYIEVKVREDCGKFDLGSDRYSLIKRVPQFVRVELNGKLKQYGGTIVWSTSQQLKTEWNDLISDIQAACIKIIPDCDCKRSMIRKKWNIGTLSLSCYTSWKFSIKI